MRELKLHNTNIVAIVDDEDYERCLHLTWYHNKVTNYVVNVTKKYKRNKSIGLHNFITGKPLVDHKDLNELNNTRENLRPCTHSLNHGNSFKKKGKYSSIYKGVSFHKQNKTWLACIKKNGLTKCLGYFKNEIEAALAYNEAAIEFYGEFAVINNFSASLCESGDVTKQ